jgi:hypothetical protein
MPASASNIQGTLHVDRYLTNYSLNWAQDQMNFVGRRAASVIPVTNQSNKFVEYDRGYFWRDEMERRPLGGRPVQVTKKVTEGTYSAEEWALEDFIDDRQRANTDAPINQDEATTEGLTQKAMIRMDRIWATNFFSAAGVWTTLRQGTASTPGANQFLQFDDANSDPIGVVDEAKDAMFQQTGFMPNTLVLGAGVRRTLRSHPDIADRIKYVGVGLADEAKLQELFDVPNVMTARGLYNAAAEGATDDFEYIVDTTAAWLGFIEPNPALNKPTAIACFAWTGLIPGATNTMGGVIERGRDDRAHSDWFQNRMAFDLKKVSADLGVFLQSAIAA